MSPRKTPTAVKRKTMNVRALLLVFLLMGTAAVADDVPWDSLTADQQKVLSSFRENWSELPAERRERLAKQHLDEGFFVHRSGLPG